jgi:hypothetical protein
MCQGHFGHQCNVLHFRRTARGQMFPAALNTNLEFRNKSPESVPASLATAQRDSWDTSANFPAPRDYQ